MSGYHKVCAFSDLGVEQPRQVHVDGVAVALVRTPDEVFAVHDECSHAAIPLSEGDVEGCEIECWLHGSRFDLRSGKPLGLPATEPVPVYACEVRDDDVYVDISITPTTNLES